MFHMRLTTIYETTPLYYMNTHFYSPTCGRTW